VDLEYSPSSYYSLTASRDCRERKLEVGSNRKGKGSLAIWKDSMTRRRWQRVGRNLDDVAPLRRMEW